MSAAGRAGFHLLRLDVASAPSPLSAIAELLVPAAAAPIFAGHFPSRPLLPGIAHLAALSQVLDELAARGQLTTGATDHTAIAEVRKFRLRREVAPGDRIELRLQAIDAVHAEGAEGAEGAAFRFELRRQPVGAQPGQTASEGIVRLGIGSCQWPAAARAPQPEPAPAAGWPPMADLLPHAPPARLLATVLAAGAGGIVCTGIIPAAHPLAGGGEAPGFLAIELAAQAAAALEALARHPGGRPRIGYLVGVRDARLPVRLPAGRALRVTAIPAGGAGALSTYEMEVREEGAGVPLAAGTISTFLAEA